VRVGFDTNGFSFSSLKISDCWLILTRFDTEIFSAGLGMLVDLRVRFPKVEAILLDGSCCCVLVAIEDVVEEEGESLR
jgi:hypothetical protein